MAVAMGCDPAKPPWPAGQSVPVSVVPADSAAALRLAGERRPDLAMAEFQVRQLVATVAGIRREPLPLVSAFADAGTGALAGENAVGSWRVGVRATVTVFDGLSRESRTDVNLALASQARAEHAALLAATAGAVASALVRVQSATRSAEHWATAVVRSTAEIDLARERLRGGLDDGLAVVEARGRLAKAKGKLIAARRSAALAVVALAAACGVAGDLRAP